MTGNTTEGVELRPDEVVVTRVLDAPRQVVWKAWTDPEHLRRWWSPNGWTTPRCTVDLRPGGVFHYCMRSPEGREFWGRGIYREIVEPERLVYVDSFSDERGRLVQPAAYGMSPAYPSEAVVTVTFTERGGRTTVTLRHAVAESAPERSGIQQGWVEMLERLEAETRGALRR